MRPLPGPHVITGLAIQIGIHELICLVTNRHEHLITRVIGRWRKQRPALVTGIVIYFAGHLIDLWPYDPLTVSWRQKFSRVNA